eukprot:12370762-Alexandrium_andersonii.AAC.1
MPDSETSSRRPLAICPSGRRGTERTRLLLSRWTLCRKRIPMRTSRILTRRKTPPRAMICPRTAGRNP